MVKNNFRKYLEKKNYYISCAWLNCNFGALAQWHGVKCEQILQEIIRFDVLIAGKKDGVVGFSLSVGTAR